MFVFAFVFAPSLKVWGGNESKARRKLVCVPVVFLVLADHVLDVMLAVFFCKFRNVFKRGFNCVLVKFGGRGFVLKRVGGLVYGEGGIRGVANISYEKFET